MTQSIPRRVALAGLAQCMLFVGDGMAMAIAGLGALGISSAPQEGADVRETVLLGYFGLVGFAGAALGAAALRGLWVGSRWATMLSVVHACATFLTCCPCVWPIAIWAIVLAMHDEVVRWPDAAARGDASVADVFR